MEDLTKRVVKKICKFGLLRKENGCDAIYCQSARGKNPPPSGLYFKIKNGEVCVATNFFSTGHSYYDSHVDTEEMKKCLERRTV